MHMLMDERTIYYINEIIIIVAAVPHYPLVIDFIICVARFMDLSTICGFLGQKIVCGWIKGQGQKYSSVDFSAYC